MKYSEAVFDKIAELRLEALGSKFLVRRYTHWLRCTCISAVVDEDVCRPMGQFYATAEHVVGVIGESRSPGQIEETRRALGWMLIEVLGGPYTENLEKRLRVHLSGLIPRWEGEAIERTSSLPLVETKAVDRPSAANTVEIAITKPGGDTPARAEEPPFGQASTVMGGSGIPVDIVAADRAALLTAYKARGRGKGVRITDAMVAKAANPGKWNDRTMVTWWKRNDQRCKPPHDRKIRTVLAKDPSDIWSPRIKSKRQPK